MAVTPTIERPEVAATEPVAEPRGAWLTARGTLSSNWVAALAVAWFALIVGASLLEPAPADPQAASPIWAQVVETTFLGTLMAMVAGMTSRSRLGALASFGAAGVFMTMVVACPVTGHHAIGAWWYAQVAGTAGLGAASLAALRS